MAERIPNNSNLRFGRHHIRFAVIAGQEGVRPGIGYESLAFRVQMEERAERQFRLLQVHIVLPEMLDRAIECFPHIFMHFEYPQFLADFPR